MKKVARIAYANTEPYFLEWPAEPFEMMTGSPRALAQAARAGDVVAGPLPVADCWALAEQFEPLGPWGIAAREESRSVLVVANRPFSELEDATIGVTADTSTSILLCDTLFKVRYGHRVRLKRGIDNGDDGCLLIGDEALRAWHRTAPLRWNVVTDLATEWWQWQRCPFVFAQWVVRKDAEASQKSWLADHVAQGLEAGLKSLPAIARALAPRLGIGPGQVIEYLQGIRYTLGQDEFDSMELFKRLASAPALSPSGV